MKEDGSVRYYSAFGLVIASEAVLDELRPARPTDNPDIRIVKGSIGYRRPEPTELSFMNFDDPSGILMVWPMVAGFRLLDDNTVVFEKYPDVEERFLAFPILGPVMAWLLNRRGLFLLHASAIDIDGRTLALMGDKMAGKSTTAAAFIRAGFPLITDDLVAVDLHSEAAPRIMPAFAQLKLTDEAAANVIIEGTTALPLVHKHFPKRQHKLPTMRSEAASIDWFVELERGGSEPCLIEFELSDAIRSLNRFSYMPRFSDANWSASDEGEHFRNCAKLASIAKVGWLGIPDGLSRLDETVSMMTRLLGGEVS